VMLMLCTCVTSVLPVLLSAAAAYDEYQFRKCLENQFNKNWILLMQNHK
jgi:hypothetical protein